MAAAQRPPAVSRINVSAASERHLTAPNAASRTGAAAPVVAANLGHQFVGETFAQGGTLKKNSDRFAHQKCLLENVFPEQKLYSEGMLKKNSDRFALQKCLLENVFPKQKFCSDSDLKFSNNLMSIC